MWKEEILAGLFLLALLIGAVGVVLLGLDDQASRGMICRMR